MYRLTLRSVRTVIPASGRSGWSDEHLDQETTLAASEEFGGRRKALASALSVLNERERRIFEARRLAEEPITLQELADEFGVSRERVRQIRGRKSAQSSASFAIFFPEQVRQPRAGRALG